mgnify:CR=1 FL=1
MLKEIYHLLLPSERRMGMRVIMAVFFSALLNFAGLAALIPVLLFLIEEKEEKGEALLFCLLAVGFILFKNVLVMGLSRFQNYFLLSLYKRLSFSLFSSILLPVFPLPYYSSPSNHSWVNLSSIILNVRTLTSF